jgi:hypothetical protein
MLRRQRVLAILVSASILAALNRRQVDGDCRMSSLTNVAMNRSSLTSDARQVSDLPETPFQIDQVSDLIRSKTFE